LRDLESALRKETVSPEQVAPQVRLYAERLRHNIAVEELMLFPAALRHLSEPDWFAIREPVLDASPDPLFAGRAERRFEELHRVISAEAGCGCDERPR
jgi:hypothetical protein